MIRGYRLSPQQDRVWHTQPGAVPFAVGRLVVLDDARDDGALVKLVERLAAHHEVLRTSFRRGPDAVLQVISGEPGVAWHTVDLQHREAGDAERCATEHFDRIMAQPFDLERPPLLRATLARLAADRVALGLVLPAVSADLVTLRLLAGELERVRAGRVEVGGDELSFLSVAEWQRGLRDSGSDAAAAAEAWSRRALGGAASALPFARRGGSATFGDGDHGPLAVPSAAAPRLDAVARAQGSSPELVILTAWATWHARTSDAREISIGLHSDGRESPELAHVLGPLSRWLPLRIGIDPTHRFSALLARVSALVADARAWQRYFVWPFARDGRPVPGQHFPALGFRWDALGAPVARPTTVLRERGHEDACTLQLAAARRGHDVALALTADAGAIAGGALERIAMQLETILDQAIADPDRTLSSFALAGDRERRRLLGDFHAPRALREPRCIHHWFEEVADRAREIVAARCEDATLTYAALDARANQIAHALQHCGVGPERRVGLCGGRSLDFLVGMLGILKAGAAYVPLDPDQPPERLRGLLEDIGAPVVLVDRRSLDRIPRAAARMLCLDADDPLVAQQPTSRATSPVTPANAAYVLFTSGSTGRPKGVVVEHRQLFHYVTSVLEQLELPSHASYATVSTFTADLGHTVIFPALVTASCLHVITAERVTDPVALVEYTQRFPIDCLKIVPSHLRALLSAGSGRELVSRQRLILGGEAMTYDHAVELQALAPHCAIYNHYGPTETTVGVLTWRFDPSRASVQTSSLPLERPVAGTQIYVLDRDLAPVATGIAGELYVAGAAVSRGYLNAPGATGERFLPDPFAFSPGQRMYRTGDLARHLPDGTLEHLGRADDQVKYHGHRVELAEIRHALNQHPEVKDSVVVLAKDTSGAARLVAYYASSGEIPQDQLCAFLGERLLEEVLPNLYAHLGKLPLNRNGKVNREALPSVDELLARSSNATAPRAEGVEAQLARIWCEVLRVPQVDVRDNFFAIGGDSILAILVVSKARQAGLKLNPRDIFKHQTIAGLARAAERTGPAAGAAGPGAGALPMTPIQRWFVDQGHELPDACCIVAMLEARASLDASALEQALSAVLAHHEVLRLRVPREAATYEARTAPADAKMPFEQLDLSALAGPALDTALQEAAQQLIARIRLDVGPAVVAGWIDLGPSRPRRLLVVAHRLVVDAVSWRILLQHLQLAYQQRAEGKPCEPPLATTSQRAWVDRLTTYASSDAALEELGHWTALAWEHARPLPTDRAAALPLTLDRSHSLVWNAEDSRGLRLDAAQALRCDTGELLVIGLAEALRAWTGDDVVALDLEAHGREDLFDGVDLSATVGWFTALYPVVLAFGAEPAAASPVRVLKEQLRKVPRRGLGYGVLRYLSPDATVRARLAEAPQPEILFRYTGQHQATPVPAFAVLAEPERQAPTRRHKLAVVVGVSDEQLHVTWYYSGLMYERSTVEALAAGFDRALRRLAQARDAEAPAVTPSDFPLAGLDQHKLDRLITRLKK